ncbi:MAG: zinc ribbon domain-containing protein [Deltaproteobacteria bacterium]|nr:zinc ribbon domain-containing protein [Deltaproteobacteria bacterium]MBW2075318.1 zinc ribbon domain-containing protein [Deltaproteobacteria bacterium]RLB80635.1 MAG: zinc ribbon domain-containing protein [Deltaproteobacteria bacterium]
MPIYEYRCPDCGHTFERLQSLQEGAVATCPECGNPAKKVMSASVGYIMKGANHPGVGRGAREGGSCCGHSSPCEHPKRCCMK